MELQPAGQHLQRLCQSDDVDPSFHAVCVPSSVEGCKLAGSFDNAGLAHGVRFTYPVDVYNGPPVPGTEHVALAVAVPVTCRRN